MTGTYQGNTPVVEAAAFVAANATLLGRVSLGRESSVWYGSVLRGDVESITVGAESNIQDLCVVHGTTGRWSVTIGRQVTVGHRAILHGCTIGDRVLVGMGAIVMDGAIVGEDSLLGAGSLISPGMQIPAGSLVLGSPGRVIRPLRSEERDEIINSAKRYVSLAREHRESGYG